MSRSRHLPTILWLTDVTLTCFVFFPVMVFYWRGIWDLFGVYIFPDSDLKRCWTTTGIGCAAVISYVTHPLLDVILRNKRPSVRWVIIKLYLAVYCVLPMAYWRGVWTTADFYFNHQGWHGALTQYLVCEVLLLVGRVRQTAIFPPLYVAMDTKADALRPTTRFRTKPEVSWQYVGDMLFSYFYALTLSILLWRGAWSVVDYVFEDVDYVWIHVLSLLVGYAATLLLLLLDPVLLAVHRFISRRHAATSSCCHLVAILAWEGAVYIVAFWAHFFLWRGAWILNTVYVIADPEIGGWLNILVGTVGFCVFNVYALVGHCGCTVDGNVDNGGERWFPVHYLINMSRDFKQCCRTHDGHVTDGELSDNKAQCRPTSV